VIPALNGRRFLPDKGGDNNDIIGTYPVRNNANLCYHSCL